MTGARDAGTQVCLVTPAVGLASETFIRAHAEQLPAAVTVVHGDPPRVGDESPRRTLAGRALGLVRRLARGQDPEGDTTRRFAATFRRLRPDVVLAEYGQTGVRVERACRATGIPLVVHFHGYDASQRDILAEYGDRYRAMFRTAAAVVAVSRAMRDRLVNDLGAIPDRLHHVVYGVDCKQFDGANPGESLPTLLAVGRFVEKKAPHLTLLAFERVARRHPDARLRMIGDGPLLGVCRDLARGLGVADRVDFLGVCPPAVVRAEMRSARAFVQHSVEASNGDCEGTPVAVLEAGATGLPVVSTRHAGIPDVVADGKTGLLVEERDVDGMAGRIEQVLANPGFAAQLGRQAREHIRANYDMAVSIDRLWQVLRAAAERRAAS